MNGRGAHIKLEDTCALASYQTHVPKGGGNYKQMRHLNCVKLNPLTTTLATGARKVPCTTRRTRKTIEPIVKIVT